MTDAVEVSTSSPSELLASGRRNLAVKEFTSAVETLAAACELLAKEHGDTADQCAEAYLWYGKALLGLSREESGVLGDGVPGTGNADAEEEDDNEEQDGENGEAAEEKTGEAEAVKENGEGESSKKPAAEKIEAESTTNEEGMSADDEEPGTTNGDAEDIEADADVSMMNADGEDEAEVDNLQLAWEMLDLSRSILFRRVQDGGGDAARALLSDVHLALGEVALESETYDKAVIDMQSCLDLQKDLYGADDRRIAETHYQIGLANSLASNFEDAITHFKNAANILGTRIKTLETPGAADDATVKKYATSDPGYSIEGEIKELKELLPEIQEKIQDMMDYKAETLKRMRESLFSNGAGSSSSSFSNGSGSFANGSSSAGSGSSQAKPAADISHLIKRKRKASDTEPESTAKRPNKNETVKKDSNEAESKREESLDKSAVAPGTSEVTTGKVEAESSDKVPENSTVNSFKVVEKEASNEAESKVKPGKSEVTTGKVEAESSDKVPETSTVNSFKVVEKEASNEAESKVTPGKSEVTSGKTESTEKVPETTAEADSSKKLDT